MELAHLKHKARVKSRKIGRYHAGDRFPVEAVASLGLAALSQRFSETKPAPTRNAFSRSISTILLALADLLFLRPWFSMPPALFGVIFGLLDPRRCSLTQLVQNRFLLIPLTSFLCGLLFYFSGTARLQGVGLPGRQANNLHPELRCYSRSSGCDVFGGEPFYQEPYNLALDLMIKTIGPMRGAYTEPYPSIEGTEEAFPLIRQCDQRAPYDAVSADPERYGCPTDLDLRRLENPYADGDPSLAIILNKDSTLIVGSEFKSCLIERDSGQCYAIYDFESLNPWPSSTSGSKTKTQSAVDFLFFADQGTLLPLGNERAPLLAARNRGEVFFPT